MRDFKKFLRDNKYDIEDKDIQWYLRGLVQFNVNAKGEQVMKEFIEIPFGAKDSELIKFEYTIPEGYEAIIENGKVIVKKMESEDEKIRKEIVRFIQMEVENEIVGNKWLAWLEKQGEQSIKMRALFAADKLASAEMTGRLKERKEIIDNPEKYGLCKKPAWSEEDEKHRNAAICACSYMIEYFENSTKIYEDANDWLKSLKPQPQWKPSEEQLNALNTLNLHGNISYVGQQRQLIELYEQLKKL